MYKVFFNQSEISFPKDIKDAQGAVFTDPDQHTIRSIIEDCFSKSCVKIAFFSQSRQELIHLFEQNFVHIQAAGGIVQHCETGEILFIHRAGRWDLPKGWMEAGEIPPQCAVREVQEECGLDKLDIQGFVKTSHHAYILKGKWTLKSTHWYAMTTTEYITKPQEEEGIEQARWFAVGEYKHALNDTYPNIKDVFRDYEEKYL